MRCNQSVLHVIRRLDEEAETFRIVSGITVGRAIELFAHGYTLEPPQSKNMSIAESAKEYAKSLNSEDQHDA